MRLDLFLKASRLFKRRSVVREQCEAGRVLVNGMGAKPAKDVKPGDRITLVYGSRSVEVEVLAIPAQKTVQKESAADLYRVTAGKKIDSDEKLWIEKPSSS